MVASWCEAAKPAAQACLKSRIFTATLIPSFQWSEHGERQTLAMRTGRSGVLKPHHPSISESSTRRWLGKSRPSSWHAHTLTLGWRAAGEEDLTSRGLVLAQFDRRPCRGPATMVLLGSGVLAGILFGLKCRSVQKVPSRRTIIHYITVTLTLPFILLFRVARSRQEFKQETVSFV